MSVRVMAWVWEHSQARGSDRLVLLAIADNANDDGGNAFPGHAELMRKTLLPRSTVYGCIERLIESGELERAEPGGGRGRRTIYRVTMGNRPAVGPFTIPETIQEPSDQRDGLGAETVRDSDLNRPGSAAAYKEEPSENHQIAPTVLTPDGVPTSGGEVIPLRSNQAVQAANGTLSRLKAEVQAGKRSWSLSEAAKAEWLALLDQVNTKPGPPQQFVIFYLSANTGRDVRSFSDFHWKMAGQKVRRWRGLVLYGVDQAITHVEPDERDERGYAGRPFWAYVERVCQRARADTAGGNT
jgi:hypothetical protein